MNKEKFIKCFAHFMTETDLNRAYNLHFKELGKKNCKEIEQWLKDILQDEWISCNKELPSESGYYRVTAIDCDIRRTTFAKYYKRQKRWELAGRRAYWKIIAWMPTPKPYGEEVKE